MNPEFLVTIEDVHEAGRVEIDFCLQAISTVMAEHSTVVPIQRLADIQDQLLDRRSEL